MSCKVLFFSSVRKATKQATVLERCNNHLMEQLILTPPEPMFTHTCKCKIFPMFFTLKKFLKYMYFSLWHHTFDPDVAVSLEVVVGSFPGVSVMSQKSDRRSRLNWYITYSLLICSTRTKYSTSSALCCYPVWVLHS